MATKKFTCVVACIASVSMEICAFSLFERVEIDPSRKWRPKIQIS